MCLPPLEIIGDVNVLRRTHKPQIPDIEGYRLSVRPHVDELFF